MMLRTATKKFRVKKLYPIRGALNPTFNSPLSSLQQNFEKQKNYSTKFNIDPSANKGTKTKHARDTLRQAKAITGLIEGDEHFDFEKFDPKEIPMPLEGTTYFESNRINDKEANAKDENDLTEELNDLEEYEKLLSEKEKINKQRKSFVPENEQEKLWYDLYNGTDAVNQKNNFLEMLEWLFSIKSERRKLFIRWLLEEKCQPQLVRRIQTAFIRMKLYGATSQIEIFDEVTKDRKLKLKSLQHDIIYGDYSNYDQAIFPHYGQYKRLMVEQERKVLHGEDVFDVYSEERDSPEVDDYFEKQENDTMPFGKRFKGTGIHIDESTLSEAKEFLDKNPIVDPEDPIFFSKKYFDPSIDPYGYMNYKEDSFEEQTSNLRHVAARLVSSNSIHGFNTNVDVLGSSAFQFDDDLTDLDPFTIDYAITKDQLPIEELLYQHQVEENLKFQFHPQYPFEGMILKEWCTSNQTGHGRVNHFSSYVIVGSEDGFVGLGYGRAPEPDQSRPKAMINAFRNLVAFPKTIDRFPNTTLFKGRYKRSLVIINYNSRPDIKGHPLFTRICKWIGLSHITIKTHGSRNPINQMLAFFDALKYLRSTEEMLYGPGKMPVHFTKGVDNYVERARQNRGAFGWN